MHVFTESGLGFSMYIRIQIPKSNIPYISTWFQHWLRVDSALVVQFYDGSLWQYMRKLPPYTDVRTYRPSKVSSVTVSYGSSSVKYVSLNQRFSDVSEH